MVFKAVEQINRSCEMSLELWISGGWDSILGNYSYGKVTVSVFPKYLLLLTV